EDVDVEGTSIRIRSAVKPGENINPVACDMHRGDLVLQRGMRIGAPQLGVLATLGVPRVSVFRRPRIAVISSGDELVPPSHKLERGQIRDSNRYAIGGLLQAFGCDVLQFPTVPDTPGSLTRALGMTMSMVDGVVLTGGSSVGERDQTPDAIAAAGTPGV